MAKFALCSTYRLWFLALVLLHSCNLNWHAALGMQLILALVLAFVEQMVRVRLNFNDLLALFAAMQHGTVLPVVNIDVLGIEVLVEASAEVAKMVVKDEFFAVLGAITQ